VRPDNACMPWSVVSLQNAILRFSRVSSAERVLAAYTLAELDDLHPIVTRLMSLMRQYAIDKDLSLVRPVAR